jgi:hypothetical protein
MRAPLQITVSLRRRRRAGGVGAGFIDTGSFLRHTAPPAPQPHSIGVLTPTVLARRITRAGEENGQWHDETVVEWRLVLRELTAQ